MSLVIRPYRPADCPAMAALFYETVHAVTEYTPRQRQAWAPGAVDLDAWNRSFLTHRTVVAEWDGRLAGFGDMDETGYLDRLYVHPDYQRRGVATAICDVLENGCPADRFVTHASLTACPFFAARGYRVVKEQQVDLMGVLLTNFVMEKNERRNRHEIRP